MGGYSGGYSHPGVLQDRPCDGDALLLPAAQLDAALTHLIRGRRALNIHISSTPPPVSSNFPPGTDHPPPFCSNSPTGIHHRAFLQARYEPRSSHTQRSTITASPSASPACHKLPPYPMYPPSLRTTSILAALPCTYLRVVAFRQAVHKGMCIGRTRSVPDLLHRGTGTAHRNVVEDRRRKQRWLLMRRSGREAWRERRAAKSGGQPRTSGGQPSYVSPAQQYTSHTSPHYWV